jgi:hypothetical protein
VRDNMSKCLYQCGDTAVCNVPFVVVPELSIWELRESKDV